MKDGGEDRIDIVGIGATAVIGVFDWERKVRQRVVLHLTLSSDVRRAARSDRLRDALDYKKVSKRVQGFVRKSRFRLLETLAEETARLLLAEFPARRVVVRVEKPGALRGATTVAVTVVRSRK